MSLMLFPTISLRRHGKAEAIQLLETASAAIAASIGQRRTAKTTTERTLPVISPVIEICDMVLEGGTIEALVNLISICNTKRTNGSNAEASSSSFPVTIHITDCSAVWFFWKALAEALGNCQHVGFYGSCTFLKKSFLEHFLASARSGELKSLRIRQTIDQEQVEALAEGFASNHVLEALDLRASQIGHNVDFGILGKALRDGCSKVKHLDLLGIQLKNAHLEAMLCDPRVLALPEARVAPCPMEALESLSLSLKTSARNHSASLGNFLAHPECRLKTLMIRYKGWENGIHVGISDIAQALETNTTLETLSLPGNSLNNWDAFLLAKAVAKNSSLRYLDVRNNHISDDGMIQLAEAAHKGTLKELGIGGNPFGIKGSKALLKAASENHNLLQIDVDVFSHADKARFINQKIRYHTALNRGARRLVHKNFPRSLWPLAMERAQLIANDETQEEKYPHFFCRNEDLLYSDVLYFLLRENATEIFPVLSLSQFVCEELKGFPET